MVWVPVLFISLSVFLFEIWIFRKNGKFPNRSGFTGCEIARQILDASGCSQIMVDMALAGDPRPHLKQLSLERAVYEGKTLSALTQAAREAVRMTRASSQVLSPDVRKRLWEICSNTLLAAWLFVLLGSFLPPLAVFKFFGLTVFVFIFLIAMAGLPAEFEASEHAYFLLRDFNHFLPDELSRIKSLLKVQRLTRLGQIFRAPMTRLRCIEI